VGAGDRLVGVDDHSDLPEPLAKVVISRCAGGATRDSLVRREGWDRLTAVKSGRVWELPARMVKRPGPGVLEGLECLAEILAP
jgi:ABC-type Fe3+-hydroxamate transport system substrate-binding protein